MHTLLLLAVAAFFHQTSTAFVHVHICKSLSQQEMIIGASPLRNSVEEDIDRDNENADENNEVITPEISAKRKVSIESEVYLPFSAEIAYDAFSDLRRQPTWSPWLHKVEYLDNATSNWILRFMGFRYSWISISTVNERPHTIQWESVSGIKNFGIVQFEKLEGSNKTRMTMKMTLIAPRPVALLFRRSNQLSSFIEKRMINSSLTSFRDVVLETDVKQTL
jgi:uncharacterized membrane protein